MLAVDTNVLVRLLVDDPGSRAQCDAARARVEKVDKVLVPLVALIEAVWVLSEHFRFSKKEILDVFQRLLEADRYEVGNGQLLRDALVTYMATNVEFGDCAIHAEAQRAGVSLLTFDRKLGRLSGVEVLRPSSFEVLRPSSF